MKKLLFFLLLPLICYSQIGIYWNALRDANGGYSINKGSTTYFRITPEGNIAVGYTTASSKLTVYGTIYSTTGGFKFPDGTTQTSASTSSSNLWINAKDYGALGDGVTDDTNAIRLALDAANTLGGGTVFFPSGTYITRTDTIHSNTQLLGTRGSIIKLKANTNLHMFLTDGTDNVIISGLGLDGNNTNQDSTNLLTSLIRADNTTNFIVENCLIYNTANAAIYSSGNSNGSKIRDNVIINHNCAINFYVSDSLQITGNYISNKGYSRITNPTAIGLDDVSYSTVANNYIYNEPYVGGSDGRFGIEIYNIAGANQVYNKVTNNTIVAGDTNFCYGGISLAASDYSIASDNLIYNARDIGAIEVATSDYCTIVGNQIDSFQVGIAINSQSLGANVSNNIFSNTPFSSPWGYGIAVEGSGADSSENRFHLFDGNIFHKVHNPYRFNGAGGWSTISNSQTDSCDHFIFMYHASYGPMNFMKIHGNKVISSDRFFSLNANDADTLIGWSVMDNESVDQLSTNIITYFRDITSYGNKGLSIPTSQDIIFDNGAIKRVLASDSLSVGASGVYQRNWYYNSADSSLAIVFYNSALSRIDTVFVKQP
jgi:hypothetical protein